jgi:hypothetical protein
MGKGQRNRDLRSTEGTETEAAGAVKWADVRALLDLTPRDIDYIVRPDRFNDESDEGAPASVYQDPALLRAWLEHHHPPAVCDGPDCRKRHYPAAVCNGGAVRANAANRATAEAVRRFRAEDPKQKIAPEAVLAFLNEKTEHDV